MLFIYDGLFSNDRLWAFIDSGTDWNPFQAYQWLTSVHGTGSKFVRYFVFLFLIPLTLGGDFFFLPLWNEAGP